MRKITVLVLMLGTIAHGALRANDPMTEIECTIKPIERSKIHRRGHPSTLQPAASPTSQSNSSNWSGYVAAPSWQPAKSNGSVGKVVAEWTVPTLSPTPDTTYCAIWIGIDGFMSGTVEQIGTSHNWVDGAQQNFAWFEMYPNGAYEITGFPMNLGDVVKGKVAYTEDNIFQLTLSNLTQQVTTNIPTTYTTSTVALRNSAEWIVEAPYAGSILPLADFQVATLTNCSAIINGVKGGINYGSWKNDEITMTNGSGIEAQPTALSQKGSAFQVAWNSE